MNRTKTASRLSFLQAAALAVAGFFGYPATMQAMLGGSLLDAPDPVVEVEADDAIAGERG